MIKLARAAIDVFEEHHSGTAVLRYLLKYAARRGPTAISRAIMKRFGRNGNHGTNPRSELTSIAVLVSGGIGDMVVTARYMRDLNTASGPLSYDVFSPNPGLAEWIFRNAGGCREHFLDSVFDQKVRSYDVGLFVPSFVRILHRRPALTNATLAAALDRAELSCARHRVCIHNHPTLDGYLAHKLQLVGETRATSLHSMSGTPYGGDAYFLPSVPDALAKFNLLNARFVTVHNGFEVQNVTSGETSTKCYPHFDSVIADLRLKHPNVQFVQIGSKTSTPIPGVHHNLIGKTSLEEASTILANTICHIDNESGLVHIASCHSTPSCVVFGPTPAEYFGYASNFNIRPLSCGNCWWTTENWMSRCPRSMAEPICTYSQPPSVVAQAASQLICKRLEVPAVSLPLMTDSLVFQH